MSTGRGSCVISQGSWDAGTARVLLLILQNRSTGQEKEAAQAGEGGGRGAARSPCPKAVQAAGGEVHQQELSAVTQAGGTEGLSHLPSSWLLTEPLRILCPWLLGNLHCLTVNRTPICFVSS